ncbi:ubiquinol-cytochrome C chaperone family protein [Marinibaculum pumilum]|uniref:Ubiquinol-cytochrome C chaperone family protein n=1 Tax=Marinibaculum pumilum TaxID=1766165 RepID=A0ABV7KTV1_9PROT
MLGVLSGFKRRAALEEASFGLYRSAIEQARLPQFYRDFAVDDSVDGRFDLLTLHVYLILRRLRREEPAGRELSQRLFDLMFADMDNNLRIMGVSDLRVGKRVKAMAQAFYGRVAAYDAGLDGADLDGGGNGAAAGDGLEEAVRRNLYRGSDSAPAARMTVYVRRCDRELATQDWSDLGRGQVAFPPPMEGAEGSSEPAAETD